MQLSFVTPYFDEAEQAQRPTYFEANHDVTRFILETPFTKVCCHACVSVDVWVRSPRCAVVRA